MLAHLRRTVMKGARKVGHVAGEVGGKVGSVLMTRRNAASGGRKPRKPKRWIQRVIRKPGTLRAAVVRRYGRRGFDREGRIKPEVLRKLSHAPGKTGKRARLAIELRRFK